MIQRCALSPYDVLAGKLMFGNKHRRGKTVVQCVSGTIALAVGLLGLTPQSSQVALFRRRR
jgi:hypothetical protein